MKLPEDFGGWFALLLYVLLVAVIIAYHPYVRGGEIEQQRLCARQALFAEQIDRDLAAGFEHLNILGEADLEVARALVECRREARQVRECVLDRCLHQRTRL